MEKLLIFTVTLAVLFAAIYYAVCFIEDCFKPLLAAMGGLG